MHLLLNGHRLLVNDDGMNLLLPHRQTGLNLLLPLCAGRCGAAALANGIGEVVPSGHFGLGFGHGQKLLQAEKRVRDA